MERGFAAIAGVTLLIAASCARDSETTPRAASPDVASGRIAQLREQFQIAPATVPMRARARRATDVPHTVIAPGVGARFVTNAAGRVDAVVSAAVKHTVVRSASVELPASAEGAVRVTDDLSHLSVAFTMAGASARPLASASDGIALYPGAAPGGNDIVHRVHAEGTEDYVVFDTKPANEELRYEVDVSHVAGLRLVSNTLEFLDEGGAPRLRVAPPYVVDSLGRAHAANIAIDACAFDADARPPEGRAVVNAGASRCSVRVTWRSVTYPVVVDPAWSATGSMAGPRAEHTASRLGSGKVLVAGGTPDGNTALATAEIYSPASGTFAATGAMAAPRTAHTATVLASGSVLMAAGDDQFGDLLGTAEIYDPTTGLFESTGSMTDQIDEHSATLLPSGKVLIAGGEDGDSIISTAELYDPAAGTFSATASMTFSRGEHTATLLDTGKVLITGGLTDVGTPPGDVVAKAELYDETAGTFSQTGSSVTARYLHAAVLLSSGHVLVAGGMISNNSAIPPLSTAEIYNPSSGQFTATGAMASPRAYPTASVLPSGLVLVAGGSTTQSASLSSAENYNPASGTFASAGTMVAARSQGTASLLASGKVLVAGGESASVSINSAELYNFAAGAICAAGADCQSGVCDEGICCAAACTNGNVCRSCAARTGACQTVTSAPDPDNCNGTQTCDASGNCKLAIGQACPGGNAACASGFCADGFCCNTACDSACGVCAAALGATANGTCSPAPAGYAGSPACGSGYACDGTDITCPTSPCTLDADCLPSDYCASNGVCQPRKAQGASCNAAADCTTASCRECASAACVDGVCCGSTACPLCEACSVALQAPGGVNGTCSAALSDSDPHDDCATSPGYPDNCLADGNCDGSGACRPYAHDNVACGTTTCNGDSVQGAICNGTGSCQASNGTSCSPYGCSNGTCDTTCMADADCLATDYCTAAHTCAPREMLAGACTADDQCVAGETCTDGVCCDMPCQGECQACDVAGHVGSCIPVTGAPHGTRTACKGAGTCAGACDGVNAAVCTYSGATTVCASSCVGSQLTESNCDSMGDCVAGEPLSCALDLACDLATNKCKATCAADPDCATGFVCTSAACEPAGGAVCTDDHTSKNTNAGADGGAGITDCTPYTCNQGTGACWQACLSQSDCLSPDVCNPSGFCVPPTAPSPGSGSSGCEVGAIDSSASRPGVTWMLVAVAIAAHRRRRRSTASRWSGSA